ncbi:response regulator [Ammoniphilus sp. CFH 90114]|uniref:response regulator n=1 Tax=Ammoniphilus sp. CFH 90114 TaxID=2493665 RepID=UPI00100F49BD|nr:response regulator [Ammoniphilus sp. CFH 90114]RXT06961.1 response regulator [Ammoniphilus sp. CFH 90114]
MAIQPIEVMIVEDDPRTAEIYKQFTQKLEGYTVSDIANTGEQALELLKIYSPDLILLDIYLPDMNGIDLLWQVRSHYRGVDVILITASNEADTVREAIRGGVFDYMIKPVMIDRFLATLKKYQGVKQQLSNSKVFRQHEVDSFFKTTPMSPILEGGSKETPLPKGIDKLTLSRIKKQLNEVNESVNVDELAKSLGITPSTSRRYLEYLLSIDEVEVELKYGAVGRPERRYKLVN